MKTNKAELEEWLRNRRLSHGGNSARKEAPKPRWVGKPSAGVEVADDWCPRIGDTIHLVNSNSGAVKEVRIDSAPDRGAFYVVWPMAGVRQVWLKDGRLRTAKVWAVDHRELRAIRERFDRSPS